MKLNKNQALAANQLHGPVLIQAGAGTGKTTTLVSRIENLLKAGIPGTNIVAITFTNKAADNLHEHLKNIQGGSEVHASTIHAFAAHILKHRSIINNIPNYAPNWHIITQNDAHYLLERCFNQYYLNKITEIVNKLTANENSDNRQELKCYLAIYNSNHEREITIDDLFGKKRDYYLQRLASAYRKQEMQLAKTALHYKNLIYFVYQGLTAYRTGCLNSYLNHQKSPQEAGDNSLKDFYINLPKYYRFSQVFTMNDFVQIVDFVVHEYLKNLHQENLMDFDSLLYNAIIVLTINPFSLKELQDQFKYINVDEYQDVSDVQELLINLLVDGTPEKNICVVGDPNQSIYRFRGANVENIIDFDQHYKNTKVIQLDENYRSTQDILTTASHVIANNSNRTLKQIDLKASKGAGKKPTVTAYDEVGDEAKGVVRDIADLIAKGVQPKQIGILYSINSQSTSLANYLTLSRIPFHVNSQIAFVDMPEVDGMIKYASLIINPADNHALKTAIMIPKRTIGTISLQSLTDYANIWHNGNLFESLPEIGSIKTPSDRHLQKSTQLAMQNFHQEIQKYQQKKYTSLGTLFTDLINNIFKDYLYQECNSNSHRYELALNNVYTLIKLGELIDQANPNLPIKKRLQKLIDQLALLGNDALTDNKTPNRIELMTIHKAKGLEFDYVFLIGINETLCPFYRQSDGIAQKDLEEERRKMYVAMTRPRKELHISYTNTSIFKKYIQPSRFISEMQKDDYQFFDKSHPKRRYW